MQAVLYEGSQKTISFKGDSHKFEVVSISDDMIVLKVDGVLKEIDFEQENSFSGFNVRLMSVQNRFLRSNMAIIEVSAQNSIGNIEDDNLIPINETASCYANQPCILRVGEAAEYNNANGAYYITPLNANGNYSVFQVGRSYDDEFAIAGMIPIATVRNINTLRIRFNSVWFESSVDALNETETYVEFSILNDLSDGGGSSDVTYQGILNMLNTVDIITSEGQIGSMSCGDVCGDSVCVSAYRGRFEGNYTVAPHYLEPRSCDAITSAVQFRLYCGCVNTP